MALSEEAWGRLLALAWVWQDAAGKFTFRDKIEKDPADGLSYLKTTPVALPNGIPKRDFLRAVGLDPDPTVKDHLFYLDSIDYPQDADFKGANCQLLDNWVAGNQPAEFEEDEWKLAIWRAPVTEPTQNILTLMEWGRIYARIWIDYMLNQLAQPCRNKYGPNQKGYGTEFERDPATVVETICNELPTLGYPPIQYTKQNTTRLFALIPKPGTWDKLQLEACVGTGKLKGPKKKDHPLCWILRKCC